MTWLLFCVVKQGLDSWRYGKREGPSSKISPKNKYEFRRTAKKYGAKAPPRQLRSQIRFALEITTLLAAGCSHTLALGTTSVCKGSTETIQFPTIMQRSIKFFFSRASSTTLALFFVATTARGFSSSAPSFLPNTCIIGGSSGGGRLLLNNKNNELSSLIYQTRGGGDNNIIGVRPSFLSTKRFSSTTEEISTMDEVKAAASKMSAHEKLTLMRKKMDEHGVDGAYHIEFLLSCSLSALLLHLLPCLQHTHTNTTQKQTQSTSSHQTIHTYLNMSPQHT